jgi:hypothetical protein
MQALEAGDVGDGLADLVRRAPQGAQVVAEDAHHDRLAVAHEHLVDPLAQ